MLVGIISDLHGTLSPQAEKALAPCDIILCAGDVERASVLMELEAIAPTIAILGNCDHFVLGDTIPATASPRIGGVRIFMVHRPEDIGMPADDVRVVVYGHTHIPHDETINGVRYLNPGSASHPRRGSKKSLMRMTIDTGTVQSVELVTL